MSDSKSSRLPAAPTAIRTATEQFGTYGGEAPWQIDVGKFDSVFREKKWQWFCAFDDSVVIGGAIVSTGYAGKSFVWVFDRSSRKMLADESRTLLPFQVSVADDVSHRHIARVRNSWSIMREGVRWTAKGRLGSIEFEIEIDEHDLLPITAICPTKGERFNITRKSVGATAQGSIRVDGRAFALDGRALLDHSHGLMDRETSWRWAIGSGAEIGFNFIDGFNDGLESVVWRRDGLSHVGAIAIDSKAWKVTDPTGAIDLTLDIEGVRSENVNLGLVTSRYSQPIGIWRGSIFGEPVALTGVAEDHHARW